MSNDLKPESLDISIYTQKKSIWQNQQLFIIKIIKVGKKETSLT